VTFVTRFAPSPTGPLHLGHAFSAITAHDMARRAGGRFLLRIEDIDRARARPEWEAAIFEDLAWLGLTWDGPVMRQRARLPAYRAALARLWEIGLLYPCTCTRRDILSALDAPQEGVTFGPDGPVYPGTCRGAARDGPMPDGAVLRLDMARALARIGEDIAFDEAGAGPAGQTGRIVLSRADLLAGVGDVVLARRDMGTSYHLAVVTDDASQGVTHVVRGQDLFEATVIHRILQILLDYPTPTYWHHRLIRDEAGKRLAKRDDARAIRTYRAEGASPADIRRMVGL
jgi:glutamyl-Q tRNA(Asp) synthetase